MSYRKIARVCAFITTLVLAPTFAGYSQSPSVEKIAVPSEDGTYINVSITHAEMPTDFEGQLRAPSVYYFIKLKYKENFYSINVPLFTYESMSVEEKVALVEYITGLYEDAFSRGAIAMARKPRGYRFNITFGRTKWGRVYNKEIFSNEKVSSIFSNCLPYQIPGKVLTQEERVVLLHEIGHSLLGISIGGITDVRMRSIEEGVVDHIAGLGPEAPGRRIYVTAEESGRLKGVAQMDIDASIWGKDKALMPSGMRGGYAGVTHHLHGREFVGAYLEVFGKDDFRQFLIRVKASRGKGEQDLGTGRIRSILKKMGHLDDEIARFEQRLHERIKENVFIEQ
ncbi:MAG: hypothetical protein P9L88_02380 [Candidatus Tantalella remota]|nr:hypothetical protein [Candidatus Tantalella remota]